MAIAGVPNPVSSAQAVSSSGAPTNPVSGRRVMSGKSGPVVVTHGAAKRSVTYGCAETDSVELKFVGADADTLLKRFGPSRSFNIYFRVKLRDWS